MTQANCTTCNAVLKQGWEVWYGTKADGNPYPYCESCWKSLNNPLGINKQQQEEKEKEKKWNPTNTNSKSNSHSTRKTSNLAATPNGKHSKKN